MPLRLLTAQDVRSALPMEEAIAAMRDAFAAVSAGLADVPLRTHIELDGGRGTTLTMPAATREPVRAGSKLLSIFPGNAGRGLPVIQGLVVMFDADTGAPAGLLEGMTLTALRTGAASGLATSMLARPDANRAAIIGSGVQARTQLEAVCAVRRIESVTVYSRTPDHAARFAEQMRGAYGAPDDIAVAASVAEAVRGADVICTATGSTTPSVFGADVSPGTHINAVGSYTPAMQEIDPALVASTNLFVDQVEATLLEAGEVIAAIAAGDLAKEHLAELGHLVNGSRPGRQSEDEVTLFKSVGLAVQDLCAAARALHRADEADIGMQVML